MKILTSGGAKTQNIVNGISKKFQATGDEFIVVPFIENVNEIYQKGDFYDKALITEQSITRENSITDEYQIRNRINRFASECAQRQQKQTYVFLTSNEELANIIYEEIAEIADSSVVILKASPYSVGFFYNILINDVHQISSEFVFKPAPITQDIPEFSDINDDIIKEDDFLSEDITTGLDNTQTIPASNDIEGFKGFDFNDDGDENTGFSDFTGGNQWSNEDGQMEFNDNPDFDNPGINSFTPGLSFEETEETNDFTSENNIDNKFDEDTTFDMNEFNNNSIPNNNFVVDETLDMEEINPIEQSGELPEFTQMEERHWSLEKEPEITDTNEAQAMDNFENTPIISEDTMSEPVNERNWTLEKDNNEMQQFNNAPIEGFDDEDYAESPADQLYGDFTPNNGQQMLFDDDMYGDSNNNGMNFSQPEEQVNIPNNESSAFDIDDYSDNNTEQQLNNAGMMAAGAMMGMDAMTQDFNNQQQQMGPTMNPQMPTKKKGFFSKGNAQQVPPVMNIMTPGKVDAGVVKQQIAPFAARGNSIVVTGCGGCGTSTIAYSLANIIAQLGYTVLLVDMDTEGRTQSYISLSNYNSMEPEGSNLMSAINSSTGINNYTCVVKQGFHLLTMGIAADAAPVNEIIHKEKISRFVNLAKTSYNFVIYDIPFQSAVGYLSEMVYMADNLVLVTDASNWGITKTMLALCNIASDEMQDNVFTRGQIVFNKFRRLSKVFGTKVKTCTDITKVMDKKVLELIGEDIGLHFDDMSIAGIINDDPQFEDGWFNDVQYSDTLIGQQIFLKLLADIVLKH